ncbi:MAG TPA: NrfD/PsrC family molybdoenzyme membrane anchor subunit [Gemmatimonadales bacterium]|nr:NrfD/PsrC family molybdoenzyme membrane anchor subunit [Gemmatimonadales bacterium]
MSDTFFTASPHWTWYIILYFFVGGIAGGAYFLAAMLAWFGRPEDRPVIRTAYSLAFWGILISGALLTIDLGRPLRFWHMLIQSNNVPTPMFKSWSPMSFGSWAILLFGLCAGLSIVGAWWDEGRVKLVAARPFRSGTLLAKLIAGLGGALGFFVAGYTGILLTVTNRPIWADSPWLGALFLASAASTAAAALILLAPRRGASASSLAWLRAFDMRALVVELIILVVFVAWVWPIRQVWLGIWGLVLLVGVVGAGIMWPLQLHARGKVGVAPAGAWRNPAVMVLLGGLLLRVVILMASSGITHERVTALGR